MCITAKSITASFLLKKLISGKTIILTVQTAGETSSQIHLQLKKKKTRQKCTDDQVKMPIKVSSDLQTV